MRIVLWCVLFCCVSACVREEAQTDVGQPVFGEHQFLAVKQANFSVGEDCTQGGSSACASALCLHVGTLKDSGYICSKACADETQCPQGWACVSLSSADSACVPPEGK